MNGTLKAFVYAMGAMLAASSFLSSYGAVSVTASRTYVVQETTLHASETAGQNVLIYTLGSQSNKFVVAKDGLDRATSLTPVTEPGTTNVIGYYIGTNVNARVASSDWMSKVSGLKPVYGQGEYPSSVIGYTLGDDTEKVVASADWLSRVVEVKPIISSDDSPSRIVGYTIGTNAYVFASDKSVEVQRVKNVTDSTTNVVGYTIGGNTNNVFMSIDGVKQVIPNYEAVSNSAMRVMSQMSDGANVVDAARNVYRISHNSWFMYKYMTREYSMPHELYYQGNVSYSNIVNGSIGTIEDFYVSNRRFASKATIYEEEVVGDVFIGVEGSTTNVVITHARRSDGVYPIIWSYPSSVSNGVIYAFNNGNTECDIRRLTDEEVSTNFVGRLALTNDVVTLVKPGLITDGTNTIYASRKFVVESGEFEWRVTSGQYGTSHVLVGQKNEAQYVPENPQDGDEAWKIYFLPYEYDSKDGLWSFYVDIYLSGDWSNNALYEEEGNIDDTTVDFGNGIYVCDLSSSGVFVGELALMSDFSTSNKMLVATIETVSPKRDSDSITDGTNIIDATGYVWEVGYRFDNDWVADSSRVTQVSWSSAGYEEDPDLWAIYFTVDGSFQAQVYSIPPGPTQTNLFISASDWETEYEGAFDFNIYRSPHTTTNLVGKLALTNDIPPTVQVVAPSTNAVKGTAADARSTGIALYTGFTEWEFSDGESHVITGPFDGGDFWYYELDHNYGDMNEFQTEAEALAATSLEFTESQTATRHLVTPTKTSQLVNDGSNGVPFAVVSQIPAPVDISGKQDALTPAQTNAVNSGVTSAKVQTWDGYAALISANVSTNALVGQTFDFSRNYDIIRATAAIAEALGATVMNNPTAQGGN